MTEYRGGVLVYSTSWVVTTIGEIAAVTKLAGFEFTNYFNYQELGDVRVIRGLNIGVGEFKTEEFKYIDSSISDALPRSQVKIGDLLINYVGTLGRVAILPDDNNRYHLGPNVGKVIIAKQIADAKFLLFFLLSPIGQSSIHQTSKAVAQSSLSMKQIRSLPIPLAPLNEQRRIVAKIEALKARSQRVKEALKDIPQLLNQFRQSVLAAAFRGDLTADWREQNPDVEPASVLLDRIQEKILISKTQKMDSDLIDPFKIPNNWKWVSLSSICHSITDGDHQAPPKANHGIPFLVISNITNGKLDFSNTRYVPEEYYRSIPEHRKPKKGDILYSVVGSYGIPVIVDTEEEFCFQRHIALLKMSNFVNSKYFLYALKSNFIFKQATEVATGTAQLTVTLSGLRKIKIPLISIDEQLEIIHRIETFFKTIDIIQQQYQETKAHLDQLDQSILAKAFRGELVPQDPDDEPASVLLEHIRAERAKLQTKAAKKSTPPTGGRRSKKASQQEAEPVQLELGLE